MSSREVELVRRTIERYVALTADDRSAILPCWKRYRFQRGAYISRAGSVEDHFYIVEEGVQRLYIEHDGAEICLGFSYGNSWTGDFDSFVRRSPGRFQVQALSDSVLLGITYADLNRLYETVPVMERFGRRILEEQVVGRATREIEQIALSAEERLDRFLQRSPHLLQLVSQKDIASYLRMTPETFSRLRARMVGRS
ncbi:MAG: Crp/Fnr family transcriptional regulator [Flavobacteriales bacterium]|nr:Crp/Fnr family transcriptional regulator [Flavobacteriales bacterium]